MGLIIKTKRHLWTRFPLWLFIIVFIAALPFTIGFIGAYFSELATGEPCHEGNCSWAAIPWFGVLITLPIGLIVLLIYVIIVLIDFIRLLTSK